MKLFGIFDRGICKVILVIDFRFTEASEKIESDYKYFLKSFANFCTQFEWVFVTALEYELEFCEI